MKSSQVTATRGQSDTFGSAMALCPGPVLATFVIVLCCPRRELGITVANGVTQAACTILGLRKCKLSLQPCICDQGDLTWCGDFRMFVLCRVTAVQTPTFSSTCYSRIC